MRFKYILSNRVRCYSIYKKNSSFFFVTKKNNNHKIFKTRLKIFNNFNDGNKYEFLSILEKVKKIYFKTRL